MRYTNRKTGAPVDAIQFTGTDSANQIYKEFGCNVVWVAHTYRAGHIVVEGAIIAMGQYVVRTMAAIVAVDQKKFDERFKLDEIQMEMF